MSFISNVPLCLVIVFHSSLYLQVPQEGCTWYLGNSQVTSFIIFVEYIAEQKIP